ncbi:MAG: hypothetical protein IH853_13825 [Bacteroidetes bacterium]|nr:hypothetical protein [Bacteroidota bacterium]
MLRASAVLCGGTFLGDDIPVQSVRFNVQLFANVLNVFDEFYIQDVADHSAFDDDPTG